MDNLSANEIIILALLQVILFLLIFFGFCWYKLNKNKRRLSAKQTDKVEVDQAQAGQAEKSRDDGPKNETNLADYLSLEIGKTSEHIKSTQDVADDKDVSGLELRLKLLEFELTYLSLEEANKISGSEVNWEDVNLKLYKILKEINRTKDLGLLKESLSPNEEGEAPSQAVLDQQNNTIKHLKNFINDLLSQMDSEALPNKELDSHFSDLEKINIELEQCVLILEDENSFLRDQIAALLKVKDAE